MQRRIRQKAPRANTRYNQMARDAAPMVVRNIQHSIRWDRPSPFVVRHASNARLSNRRQKAIPCPTYSLMPFITWSMSR